MKYNEYSKIVKSLKCASLITISKLNKDFISIQDLYTLDKLYKFIFSNLQKLAVISKKDNMTELAKYYCVGLYK